MIELVESIAALPEIWPTSGTVSDDNSAVIGHNYEMYIYQGSNNHRDAYFIETQNEVLGKWIELIETRHQRYSSQSVKVLSLVVPNKATCMPWDFPEPLPRCGSSLFRSLKSRFLNDPRVLFPFEKMNLPDSLMSGAWNRTDTHWSQSGCLLAVNEILQSLDLPLMDMAIEMRQSAFYGDLADKWGEISICEMRKDLCCPDLISITPKLEFDNCKDLSGHFGRHVRWVNKFAKHDLIVTIVGGSSSGTGHSKRELTWWLARQFSEVNFIHMPNCPIDVVNVTACDILVIQTVERFLYLAPDDNLSYSELIELARKSQ
jgi:alginate O-acetyltransferase complex protein AlgJ